MLRFKALAEVKSVLPNVEYHGDDVKKSVAIGFVLKDVPIEDVEAGFVAQLSLFYNSKDALKLSDIEHEFKVIRSVENVDVDMGGAVKLHGMRVRKVRVALKEAKRAEVRMTVVGLIDSGLDRIHDFLRQSVVVTLVEQVEKPETAQQQAA